ncbi:MAG: DMT family transporter [Myxococcota bacterium]|nr:DMT family transporter [Myxococcota bacterium]
MSTAVPAPAPLVTSATVVAPSPKPHTVSAALVLVQIAFGTLPVAGKLAMEHVGPFGLSLVRVAGATIFFGALVMLRAKSAADPADQGKKSAADPADQGKKSAADPADSATKVRIPFGDVLRIAGCGLLGMAANQLLFLGGLERTSATNATVLVTTIPIFTFLVALGLGIERATARGVLGLVVAFAGVLALVKVERFELAASSLLGDAMIVANALCYAFYLVLVRPYVARYGTLPIVAIGFGASTLAVLPFGVSQLDGVTSAGAHAWLLLLYVLAVPTLLTYLLNAWALRYASSSTVAIFIYLQPIVGLALAVTVLDEPLGLRAGLGTLAVFCGIALVTWRGARRDTAGRAT